MSDVDNPRRRPKGDKRARTRNKLLAAARELVREKGYAQVTLEDVAARAGMTTGAIYGNFQNRDELFIALSDAYWAPILPDVPSDASFQDILRAFAVATFSAVPDRRLSAGGFLSGRAYALSDEGVRERARDEMKAGYDAGAAWLVSAAQESELPYSPEVMVKLFHVLADGLILQHLLAPDLYDEEVFIAAFDLLGAKRSTE